MNTCENEAVIAFDTLYTQNHIQILKILLPYFDPYGQNHLAVWIKYLELRYTLAYVSRHPASPCKNIKTGTTSPDLAALFEQIKIFCSPQEKAMFGELLNLQKNLEMFEEMKEMMQLFETLRESAPDADADSFAADATPGFTETSAGAGSYGTNETAGFAEASESVTSKTADATGGQSASAFDSTSASPTGNSSASDTFDPMTFLKGMLSPEQQAMFEAFRDGL